MKVLNVLLVMSILSVVAQAKTVKVAVIDTGYDFSSEWAGADTLGLVKPKLCATGHKDFTGEGINDTHGHGSHIAGLIAAYAGKADYCLVILKFYQEGDSNGRQNLANSNAAIKYAREIKVDIINYSGGGEVWNEEERDEVRQFLNNGGALVAASGNESKELVSNSFYPASYDTRITVVGATNKSGEVLDISNYGGVVDTYAIGKDVMSILPNNRFGTMTGTSQATAKVTGFLVLKQSLTMSGRSINNDN